MLLGEGQHVWRTEKRVLTKKECGRLIIDGVARVLVLVVLLLLVAVVVVVVVLLLLVLLPVLVLLVLLLLVLLLLILRFVSTQDGWGEHLDSIDGKVHAYIRIPPVVVDS